MVELVGRLRSSSSGTALRVRLSGYFRILSNSC